jgi:hypothetical protein
MVSPHQLAWVGFRPKSSVLVPQKTAKTSLKSDRPPADDDGSLQYWSGGGDSLKTQYNSYNF